MAVNVNNYTWTQLNAATGIAMDGIHGAYFTATGKHHIWGGWTGGSSTFNSQYSSSNGGVTWGADAAASWTGRHTCAYCKVGETVYMVNGDIYNFANDGAYARGSYSFDGTTWTTITTNNGLSGYSLGSLVYLNGNFYFIGGQLDGTRGTFRQEVWISTDNCANFTYLAACPGDFGNVGGNICVFNNKIWKIGGGLYDNTATNTSYPRRIYNSSDGITWTVAGYMPYGMYGRSYSQLIVFDNAMWMIGGANVYVTGVVNLQEVWASDDGTTWTKQTPGWTGRHATTAWLGTDGIYMGWGTSGPTSAVRQGDIWKMTKN